MDCKGCAKCCVDPTLAIRLEERHKKFEFVQWLLGFGFDVQVVRDVAYIRVKGRCMWLNDENKCDIYDKRPMLCRAYECERGDGPSNI